MAKKLFLATFSLNVSYYMQDGSKDEDYTRLVWANDADEVESILESQKEFQTDEYSVYRHIRGLEVTEALGAVEEIS